MMRAKNLAVLAVMMGLAWPAAVETTSTKTPAATIDPQAKDQTEQFLTAHGYAKPLMLFADPSCWTGTASRKGEVVYVEVRRDGTITER